MGLGRLKGDSDDPRLLVFLRLEVVGPGFRVLASCLPTFYHISEHSVHYGKLGQVKDPPGPSLLFSARSSNRTPQVGARTNTEGPRRKAATLPLGRTAVPRLGTESVETLSPAFQLAHSCKRHPCEQPDLDESSTGPGQKCLEESQARKVSEDSQGASAAAEHGVFQHGQSAQSTQRSTCMPHLSLTGIPKAHGQCYAVNTVTMRENRWNCLPVRKLPQQCMHVIDMPDGQGASVPMAFILDASSASCVFWPQFCKIPEPQEVKTVISSARLQNLPDEGQASTIHTANSVGFK